MPNHGNFISHATNVQVDVVSHSFTFLNVYYLRVWFVSKHGTIKMFIAANSKKIYKHLQTMKHLKFNIVLTGAAKMPDIYFYFCIANLLQLIPVSKSGSEPQELLPHPTPLPPPPRHQLWSLQSITCNCLGIFLQYAKRRTLEIWKSINEWNCYAV